MGHIPTAELFLEPIPDPPDGSGGAVIVLHERLDALKNIFLGVTEARSDGGLAVKVEEIGWSGDAEMKFVSGAEEEIVGIPKGFHSGGGEETAFGEPLDRVDPVADAGEPEDELIVAEAADTIFDIGFLIEDGVAVFVAAIALGADLVCDVGGGLAFAVFGGVGVVEFAVEGIGAEDVAGFEKGVLGLRFSASLDEGLFDIADRVADFEPHVPKGVEGFLGDDFEKPADVGIFLASGGEEEDVDITVGGHLAASVPTETDDGEGAGRGADIAFIDPQGGAAKFLQEDIDQDGASPADAKAAIPFAMIAVNHLPLEPVKFTVSGGPGFAVGNLVEPDSRFGMGADSAEEGILELKYQSKWRLDSDGLPVSGPSL